LLCGWIDNKHQNNSWSEFDPESCLQSVESYKLRNRKSYKLNEHVKIN